MTKRDKVPWWFPAASPWSPPAAMFDRPRPGESNRLSRGEGEGCSMRVLGINSVFHDPAAALVVDGAVVGGRRGGALQPAQARQAAGAVLRLGAAGLPPPAGACARPAWRRRRRPDRLFLRPGAWCAPPRRWALDDPWDDLRTMYATHGTASSSPRRCPAWIRTGPASCATTWRTPPRPALAAVPGAECSVLVCDGRGEQRVLPRPAGTPRRPAGGPGHPAAAALARPAVRGR